MIFAKIYLIVLFIKGKFTLFFKLTFIRFLIIRFVFILFFILDWTGLVWFGLFHLIQWKQRNRQMKILMPANTHTRVQT